MCPQNPAEIRTLGAKRVRGEPGLPASLMERRSCRQAQRPRPALPKRNWADPGIDRNTHRIEVDADTARFAMTIEGVPSENPRTGRIVPLSAIAALRGLVSELKVGT